MPFQMDVSDTSAAYVKDYSTYENNATLNGPPTWVNNGVVGGAYDFTASSSERIHLSQSYTVEETVYTVSVWFNVDSSVAECYS